LKKKPHPELQRERAKIFILQPLFFGRLLKAAVLGDDVERFPFTIDGPREKLKKKI